MNNKEIVQQGKIVTIIFKGPSKKPINISINNGRSSNKRGAVCISPLTPLAQAIIDHKIGENIEFDSAEGKLRVKIMGVST